MSRGLRGSCSRASSCGLVLLILLLGISPTEAESSVTEMTIAFIDVGQGDATLIRDGNGFDVLVDGGRKSAGDDLIEYILASGVDDLGRPPTAASRSHHRDRERAPERASAGFCQSCRRPAARHRRSRPQNLLSYSTRRQNDVRGYGEQDS